VGIFKRSIAKNDTKKMCPHNRIFYREAVYPCRQAGFWGGFFISPERSRRISTKKEKKKYLEKYLEIELSWCKFKLIITA
jgi:hypothetical protein